MNLKTSNLISIALIGLQAFAQMQDSLPEEYKLLALYAHILVKELQTNIVHHYNTDGTTQRAPFVPASSPANAGANAHTSFPEDPQ